MMLTEISENLTPELLDRFEAITEEMAQFEHGPDPEVYAKLSRRFHATVAEAAGSPTLARFIDQTRYQLVRRQFWNADIIHPRPESLDQHKAIVVALRGRDSLAAERIMRLHVSSARDSLTLRLDETEEAIDPVI